MHFPSEGIIAELQQANKLDEALELYASIITNSEDYSLSSQFVKTYVDLAPTPANREVLANKLLRKAIYFLIFRKNLIRDVTIETYWNLVSMFGVNNQSACLEYLSQAPRSVSLKLGRLLLYKVEFAEKDPYFENVNQFEQVLLLFLGVPLIRETVITPEFSDTVNKLAKTSKGESSKLANILANYFNALGPDSEALKLCTLFPQLSLPEALFLLRDLANTAEQISEIMFDEPESIKSMLETKQKSTKSSKTRLIRLDDQEKEHRRELLRDFNRRNFKYEYTELDNDESDDYMEEERSNEMALLSTEDEALSKADKKLVALEDQLWAYWHSNKSLFDHSARKLKERAVMRSQLDWTNEQIEGWGRMVGQRGKNKELVGVSNEVESYAPKLRLSEPISSTPRVSEPAFNKQNGKNSDGKNSDGKKNDGKKNDGKPHAKKPGPRSGRRAKNSGKDANN